MREWEVLLDGDLADEARAVLTEIAASLERVEIDDAGVSHGAAGLALFFAHYGFAFEDTRTLERGASWLKHAALAFPRIADDSLFTGLSGIGWTLEHLAPADPGANDRNDALDARLERVLSAEAWSEPYDLSSGLVGYAVYALSRLPRPRAVKILERIVTHLDRLAVHTEHYSRWRTSVNERWSGVRAVAPASYYDLGVCHGTAGVIGVLARIVAAGIAVPTARRLLERAVSWLLAQRLEGDAWFPAWVSDGSDPQAPARSAWCYGDPGIAAVLLRSATLLREATWLDVATRLARTAALRPRENSGVVDTCMCHGAFGLGLTFLRCWQVAGDPLLREASKQWFAHGLATRQPGLPYFDPETREWRCSAGFIDGAAGSGLALLAALSGEEPSWDRLLLLS